MAIDPVVFNALLLTSMGAAGTALGAFLVVLQPKMQFQRLGVFQGVAGGLMLSISVFDLFQESREAVGTLWANVWFFAGVVFFAAVVHFIPEPELGPMVAADDDDEDADGGGRAGGNAPGRDDVSAVTTATAKGGATRRSAAKADAPADAAAGSAGEVAAHPHGAAAAAPPHGGAKGAKASKLEAKRRVLMSGVITAIGIALHNFPEGVAVFLSSMKSTALGASIACAIALHNIPEGVAVALPVYFATGSRWTGFMYAFLSGLAEPAAVVLLGLMFPSNLDKSLVDCLLAAVGGIMAFLALSELLPLSIEHAGRKAAIASLFGGMALMSANLYVLHEFMLPHDHGHDHDHHH